MIYLKLKVIWSQSLTNMSLQCDMKGTGMPKRIFMIGKHMNKETIRFTQRGNHEHMLKVV